MRLILQRVAEGDDAVRQIKGCCKSQFFCMCAGSGLVFLKSVGCEESISVHRKATIRPRSTMFSPVSVVHVQSKMTDYFKANEELEPNATQCSGPCVMALDTETNGTRRTSSVIEIGYVVSIPGSPAKRVSKVVRLPSDEPFSEAAFAVHGISEEDVRNGEDPATVLSQMFADAFAVKEAGGRIAAHNARFDASRIQYTAEVAGVDVPEWWTVFCTMRASKGRFECNNAMGRPKNPRLDELHEHLFLALPSGELHRALADAEVLLRCYVEGEKRGWW